MKKSIFILAVLSVMTMISCQENAANKVMEENVATAADRDAAANKFPVISFETEEYDFGTIEQGTRVEHKFEFVNNGDAPLLILDASSSCGCTVPQWTKDPIAPGEKGSLLVKFDGSGQNQVTKTINLVTNTKEGKENLRIKAFVNPKNPTTSAIK